MPEIGIVSDVYKLLGIGGIAALAVYVTVRYLVTWLRKALEESSLRMMEMQKRFDDRYDLAQKSWMETLDRTMARFEKMHQSLEGKIDAVNGKIDGLWKVKP